MNLHLQPSNFHPRRLLVRGVNWLGDAVMATPALLRLRERFPDTHVALLTLAQWKDLWRSHPAVNEAVSLAEGESPWSVGRRLREGCFDLALVLPNSPRSAIEVWRAGIPQRIGYARPWRNWFLTLAIPTRPGHVRMRKRSPGEIRRLIADPRSGSSSGPMKPVAGVVGSDAFHQIHEYLYLGGALGANPEPVAPQLFVGPEEVAATREKFGLPEESRPIIGLNPGATYGSAKRWPIERFIAAATQIQACTHCLWLLFGGSDEDKRLAAQIASQLENSRSKTQNPKLGVQDLAGRTTLRELMALLKSCRVLLTNDTGPMHVAAALGTPVVVPFGSTSSHLTGPGLPGDPRHHLIQSDAPCAPCFLRECPIDFRCMNGIAVERVVDAVIAAV